MYSDDSEDEETNKEQSDEESDGDHDESYQDETMEPDILESDPSGNDDDDQNEESDGDQDESNLDETMEGDLLESDQSGNEDEREDEDEGSGEVLDQSNQDETMEDDLQESESNGEDSRFHFHLTKLKPFRLHHPENNFSKAKGQAVGHIEGILDINDIEDEDEAKRKIRTLDFVDQKQFSTNTEIFFFREYDIEKKGKYREKYEPKFGTITFVYWINKHPMHREEVPMYAVLNNRLCQAWSMLKSRRRLGFPLAIAKQILDPATIRSANICYLSNGNIGSDKIKFNTSNKYNANEIMAKYGIVSGLEAHIDPKSVNGRRFLEQISAPRGNQNMIEGESSEEIVQKLPLVTIQKGQIAFFTNRIKENSAELLKPHHHFFKLVEKIYRDSVSEETAEKWKFVDYIKQETDRRTINNLEKKQLEKIFRWIFNEAASSQGSQDCDSDFLDEDLAKLIDNSLLHIYQDMFDEGTGIKILYKNQLIHDFASTKGSAITIKDVITASRAHFRQVDVEKPIKPDDIKDIFLQYFNFNTFVDTREAFYKMISDHINLGMESNDTVKPYFQYKGLWFSLTYDTFLESSIKFLNVVKCFEKSNETSGKDSLELLEWNTVPKQRLQFTMDDLLKHCAVRDMTNDDRKKLGKKLAGILTLDNRIFVDDAGHSNTLVTKNSNGVPDGAAYIDLNTSILPTSKFFNKFPSSFKTGKQKNIKREVLNALRRPGPIKQRLLDIATDAKLPQNDIDTFLKNFDESFKILEKINHVTGEKVRYIVDNPYLTSYVWRKIKKAAKDHSNEICPGRLIQFLRMKFYLREESDYNELYHLSNCPCHSNGWLYVVGDRIFNEENHKVELFDVLCYQNTTKNAYLLHVKKDFTASSVRTAMSQVRVCHELVWRALSCLSQNNAFQQLYRAAKAKDSSGYLHDELAFSEMQQIGKDEHLFVNALQNDSNNFKIVYSPCMPKCSLSDLHQYDLQINILKKTAQFHDCNDFLKDKGYVDPQWGRPKGKLLDVLNKKIFFIDQLAKCIVENGSRDGSPKENTMIDVAKTTAVQIYDVICKAISGGSTNIAMLNKSFVARREITELAKLHCFGAKININILQIPSRGIETAKQVDHCTCQKEGTSACKNKRNCVCYREKKSCKGTCYCSRTHSCGNQFGQAGQVKITDMMEFRTPAKRPRVNTDHGQ